MAILLKNVNPTILGNQDNTIEVVNNLFAGGNIGAGTSSPLVKLHAVTAGSTQQLRLGNSTSSTYWDFYSYSDGNLYVNNNVNTKFTIANSGNVGIGWYNPVSKLNITDGVAPYAAGTGEMLQIKRGTTNGSSAAQTRITISNNSNSFAIAYGGTSDRLSFIDGGNIEVLSLTNGGNVGIRTSSPRATLDLGPDGSILVIGGTGSGGYLRFGANNGGNAIEYASNGFNYYTNQTYGHRFYKNGVERLKLGNGEDINARVEAFGRVKLWPTDGTTSGIWFTGTGGSLTTFVGKLGLNDDSGFGFYYNGWRLYVNPTDVLIGPGTNLSMSNGGRILPLGGDVTADANNGLSWYAPVPDAYGIYRESGPWAHPYPDLRIAFHTGIKIGAWSGYGGTRFYNDWHMPTEIFSVGNGDNKIRAHYGAIINNGLTVSTTLEIVGNNTSRLISYGDSTPNNPLHTSFYGGWSGIGMDQVSAGVRIAGDPSVLIFDAGYYSGYVPNHANWVSLLKVMPSGNVGIGIANPATKLHVYGYEGKFQSPGGQLMLNLQGGSGKTYGLLVNPHWAENSFFIYDVTGDAARLVINSSGDVGIGLGANAPRAKLDVVGSILTEGLLGKLYVTSGGVIDTGITADSFTVLEVIGSVNPNAGGSGVYADPIHLYIYNGVGYAGNNVSRSIYVNQIAPLAREVYITGWSGSGNEIQAVWWNGSTESDVVNYGSQAQVRIKAMSYNTNHTSNFTVRIIKRF